MKTASHDLSRLFTFASFFALVTLADRVQAQDQVDPLATVAEADGILLGPPEFQFESLPRDKAAQGTFFVDVPAADRFEIKRLRSDSPECQLKMRPATEEERKTRDESKTLMAVDFAFEKGRRYNERVTVKIDFDVHLKEGNEERTLPRQVKVHLGTASRMTISGDIRHGNQIAMDVVKATRGKKMFFNVKVRDEEKRLAIKSVKSTVKCLKVHLEPQKDSETNGLYRMTFEIPKNSPPEWHMSTEDYGVVDIVFDHPRIKPAQFLVQVAVVDED